MQHFDIFRLSYFKTDGKSFINIKNRIGPKMVPCGTPYKTFLHSE